MASRIEVSNNRIFVSFDGDAFGVTVTKRIDFDGKTIEPAYVGFPGSGNVDHCKARETAKLIDKAADLAENLDDLIVIPEDFLRINIESWVDYFSIEREKDYSLLFLVPEDCIIFQAEKNVP